MPPIPGKPSKQPPALLPPPPSPPSPHTHTGSISLCLTTVAVPTRLLPGSTHPGKESTAQMVLVPPCCVKRTEVKRSKGRHTVCPVQTTGFQSQRGSPIRTRDGARYSTSGALAGPKGSTSKEGLSLALWPQAKHVPSLVSIQHQARSRRSDREVHQEMPVSAFIKTRAVKHAVEAQQNHSFSREGGKTL